MIDAGVNNARAKDAETFVVPLREALVGYEFDPRVEMASAMSLSGLDWFGAKQTRLTRMSRAMRLSRRSTPRPRRSSLCLPEERDHADFSAILVILVTQLFTKENRAGEKPNVRLNPKNLLRARRSS